MPTPVEPDAPLYVSIQSAARLTELSDDTIRRAIATGQLEAFRASRQLIRIPVAALESYMRARPIGGGA